VGGYVRAPVALGAGASVIAGVFGPRPRIVSLAASDGRIRWEFAVTVADSPQLGIASGALVDVDGNIFVGAHDDYLYSLTPDGELRWALATGGDVDGSPVLGTDGTLFVGADDRRMYALR
jgi:outer membrane protein assembly factor BamB